jgi:hypothetical protein
MTRLARACALLALALLTALALSAGPAAAKDGKGRHKGQKKGHHAKVMPKGWVERNRAKGGVKGDPDDDGLSNWGEWRSRTKPRKLDTDRDGIGDGEEDFDGDGLDNASEVALGLDPARADSDRDGVPDGDEDADGDGLSNAVEDELGQDPADADTDGDGVADGDENAGRVAAFDGTTLTIALAGGGTVSGTVDGDTEVYCDVEAGYEDEAAWSDEDDEAWSDEDEDESWDDDESGDDDADESGDGDGADLSTVTARLAEEGDEDDAGDEDFSEDTGDDCSAELVPGAVVHEAELEDGVFWAVELVAGG